MKLRLLVRDLLFPPRCLFCGEILPIGAACAQCAPLEAALRLAPAALAEGNATRALGALDGLCAVFAYTQQAAELVLDYKFRDRSELAEAMGARMAAEARRRFEGVVFDFAAPVPGCRRSDLHAVLLAGETALALGVPARKKALRKLRETPKQHESTPQQRAVNLRGAFAADPALCAGRTVLLCDDVCTSGHTLNECALALRRAGAARVYGCVFTATLR